MVKSELEFDIFKNPMDKELLSKSEDEEIVPYFEDYDDKRMWMSYWYQINEVLKTEGKEILVVGVGNKTVSNYLKTLSDYLVDKDMKVTTADLDENLNPDRICDVSRLTETFDSNSFDTVLCAEVLEHVPFNKFDKSLRELGKVTRDWVILSLPYSGRDFRLSLEFPQSSGREITVKFPDKAEHQYDGWHRWEVGKKGYSREKISNIIAKYFEISRSFYPPENMYHLFYVLRKNNNL